MKANIHKFETGWYGIQIGLSEHDINKLIADLKELKDSKGHFHRRSDFEGDGGIGDIEFSYLESDEIGNLQ